MGKSTCSYKPSFRRVYSTLAPLLSWLALLSLRGYQLLISPLLPVSCRFMPSCSEYAREAIQLYGAGRGSLLGLKRISRCHPFTAGGYDPVPVPLQRRYWFRSHSG